jgi:hypothetical protein
MSDASSPAVVRLYCEIESQNTNHRKIPAYVGAVFLNQGARFEGGFGFALAI